MTKGKVVNIKEGKEKIQTIVIRINDAEYDFEKEVYVNDKLTIEDIAGYQVNGDLIGITRKDGGNIVIPMRRIDYIETSFTDKE